MNNNNNDNNNSNNNDNNNNNNNENFITEELSKLQYQEAIINTAFISDETPGSPQSLTGTLSNKMLMFLDVSAFYFDGHKCRMMHVLPLPYICLSFLKHLC